MGEISNKHFGKIITGVVFFTFLAKIMGFFREILLSYFYGATGISDAYLISQNIPGTIFQLVGMGLTTCFIPMYFRIKNEKNKKEANSFSNSIITMCLCFSTIVIIVIWSATPWVVKLFASGFEGNTLYYAVWFTRICILSLYFSSIMYVYNSYLQANGNFNIPAFAAIPNSICIMIAIVLGSKVNIWLLSIGSVVAVGVQVAVLVPAIRKFDYRYKPNFNWNNIYVKSFFTLMGPVIIGVSVNEINTLVDRTVASQVAVGGISALTYASSLIQFIEGGLIQPIVTVFYPKITSAVAEHDNQTAKEIVEKTLVMLLSILIPIFVGFVVFAKPITQLLFGRGKFDSSAVRLTSIAVMFYALGICFVGVRELLSRYFYAYSNTKTPMVNATLGVMVNIIMNLVLSRFLGIGGLALATSVSAFITGVLLIKDTRKKIPGGVIRISMTQFVKICMASVIMGSIAYLTFVIIPLSENLSLIISVFVGIVVYGMVGVLLKIELVSLIIQMFKGVLNK